MEGTLERTSEPNVKPWHVDGRNPAPKKPRNDNGVIKIGWGGVPNPSESGLIPARFHPVGHSPYYINQVG